MMDSLQCHGGEIFFFGYPSKVFGYRGNRVRLPPNLLGVTTKRETIFSGILIMSCYTVNMNQALNA